MEKHFETFEQSRKLLFKIISNLNNDQLNCIPSGFKNNIAWNIIHLVVTEQLLCYRLSGIPCSIDEDWIQNFQKGTSPGGIIQEDLLQKALVHFEKQPEELKSDYENGIFKSYSPYNTSLNVTLSSIDEAIVFNTYHEGIHLGIILQFLKLI